MHFDEAVHGESCLWLCFWEGIDERARICVSGLFCVPGPLRRHRHRCSSSSCFSSCPSSCERGWGFDRLVASSSRGGASSFGDENTLRRPPPDLSPFTSRGFRKGPRGDGDEGRSSSSYSFLQQDRWWCSNAPDCCCSDCAEEVVAVRRREGHSHGVSKVNEKKQSRQSNRPNPQPPPVMR